MEKNVEESLVYRLANLALSYAQGDDNLCSRLLHLAADAARMRNDLAEAQETIRKLRLELMAKS